MSKQGGAVEIPSLAQAIAIISIIGVAFGAWFKFESKMQGYTPMHEHSVLVQTVGQTQAEIQEYKLMNDLRWFQFQLRTNCVTAAQQATEQCKWLKDEAANLERKLQEIRRGR